MSRRTMRSPRAAPPACFLCGSPLGPADLKDAFERVRDDVAPVRSEYAHAECADQAGLWEEPDDEDGTA